MTGKKRSLKVSTKLNLVFFLCLMVVTAVQTWLRFNSNLGMAFLVSTALTGLAFGVTWIFTHRVVTKSLAELLSVARRWNQGELTAQADLQSRDEFQQLGDSFNNLSRELNHTLKSLEKTITERTLILQRRAKQLQAAAEVGRAAVTIRDLNLLLPEVTRLISVRFDVYHVGIFLLDPGGEFAVLRATNSEGGKKLLEEQHKLRVGYQGIVGFVAQQGEPRISLDVDEDAIHFRNPLLPETHSEMALPLIVAGKILGVLDVQSTRVSAFSEEDISVLQIMADQVAIAIDNAHLLAETREALEKSRRAYGELSRDVWNKFLRSKPDAGYIISKSDEGIRHLTPAWNPELSVASEDAQVASADPKTIAIPIKLREQVIGVFRLQKSEDDHDWTDEEIDLMSTISDQVSIALESARLYEETQRRAERERLAGEITAKIRATNDPQEILQVAARELRQALQVKRAQVMVKTSLLEDGTSNSGNNGSYDGQS